MTLANGIYDGIRIAGRNKKSFSIFDLSIQKKRCLILSRRVVEIKSLASFLSAGWNVILFKKLEIRSSTVKIYKNAFKHLKIFRGKGFLINDIHAFTLRMKNICMP